MSLSNLPTIRPSLLLDFQKAEVVDSRVTFARASTATRFNSYGVLESVANNVPRIDFDPTTLVSRGLLIEEQRTNSIRNNTMQGAAAGTPGTLPTNWSTFTSLTGLTREIVGTGAESGITYIDIRVSGTPSGSGAYQIYTDTATSTAALSGQTWSSSFYFKLQAGTATGVSGWFNNIAELTAAGGFIVNSNSSFSPTIAALSTQRSTHTRTLNQATCAFVNPYIAINLTGVAVDFTLRIGLPQLEQGAFATSVIPTTTTALTRNADVASMTGTNFSGWYNNAAGTFVLQAVGLMPDGLSGQRSFIAATDGTYNNQIQIAKTAAGNSWRNEIFASGGGAQASIVFLNGYVQNSSAKLALAYETNNVNAALNGTAGTTDTSATIPSVNKLELRDPTGASGGQPTCYIQRISYYPVRLGNSTLQALTST